MHIDIIVALLLIGAAFGFTIGVIAAAPSEGDVRRQAQQDRDDAAQAIVAEQHINATI